MYRHIPHTTHIYLVRQTLAIHEPLQIRDGIRADNTSDVADEEPRRQRNQVEGWRNHSVNQSACLRVWKPQICDWWKRVWYNARSVHLSTFKPFWSQFLFTTTTKNSRSQNSKCQVIIPDCKPSRFRGQQRSHQWAREPLRRRGHRQRQWPRKSGKRLDGWTKHIIIIKSTVKMTSLE